MMTNLRKVPRRFKPALLAVSCLTASAFAGMNEPFEAGYSVLVDGKPRLESTVTLQNDGDQWQLRSQGQGTKGLARLLNVSNDESARVEWTGSAFRPVNYRHHSKVAGRDERWSAAFDHENGTVILQHEEGEDSFPDQGSTWDPLSLTLELRRRLAAGETDFEILVADEDEIDTHRYRAAAGEYMDTALGCMEVVSLERVRENSSRYSRAWYAIAHQYLPVRVRHGKQGGKDFDMRIETLTIDGQAVGTGKPCESR